MRWHVHILSLEFLLASPQGCSGCGCKSPQTKNKKRRWRFLVSHRVCSEQLFWGRFHGITSQVRKNRIARTRSCLCMRGMYSLLRTQWSWRQGISAAFAVMNSKLLQRDEDFAMQPSKMSRASGLFAEKAAVQCSTLIFQSNCLRYSRLRLISMCFSADSFELTMFSNHTSLEPGNRELCWLSFHAVHGVFSREC